MIHSSLSRQKHRASKLVSYLLVYLALLFLLRMFLKDARASKIECATDVECMTDSVADLALLLPSSSLKPIAQLDLE